MEERIQNLENQLRAALEELESIKKELAEEKAKNVALETENSELKEQVKEWQAKYEEEHKLVIKLTKENEELKLRIVELENQLKIEDEKPYDVHDLRKYMQLQNAIRDLTAKLETLDAREKKADEKLLNRIQKVEADVVELKDTDKSLLTEVSDLIEEVEELQEQKKSDSTTVEEETKPDISRESTQTDLKKEVEAFYTEFCDGLD